MALEMSLKTLVHRPVDKYRVTDTTGQYGTANLGGWGDPNVELSESAIWAIVIRKASTGDELLTPVLSNFVYDPTAANDKQTSIEFNYLNDGHLESYMGQLPVSLDGDTYVSGGTIGEGEYFYWSSGDTFAWKREGGVNIAVESLAELIENEGIVTQTFCEELIPARIAIELQSLYKKYRLQRDTKCDDAEQVFQQLLKLQQDVQGAFYAFHSDLKVEAQTQIEDKLAEYQLLNKY
jgi:hypothetical protein